MLHDMFFYMHFRIQNFFPRNVSIFYERVRLWTSSTLHVVCLQATYVRIICEHERHAHGIQHKFLYTSAAVFMVNESDPFTTVSIPACSHSHVID